MIPIKNSYTNRYQRCSKHILPVTELFFSFFFCQWQNMTKKRSLPLNALTKEVCQENLCSKVVGKDAGCCFTHEDEETGRLSGLCYFRVTRYPNMHVFVYERRPKGTHARTRRRRKLHKERGLARNRTQDLLDSNSLQHHDHVCLWLFIILLRGISLTK